MIVVRATNDSEDIKRVGQAGGELHFERCGRLVFRFPSFTQYEMFRNLQETAKNRPVSSLVGSAKS